MQNRNAIHLHVKCARGRIVGALCAPTQYLVDFRRTQKVHLHVQYKQIIYHSHSETDQHNNKQVTTTHRATHALLHIHLVTLPQKSTYCSSFMSSV